MIYDLYLTGMGAKAIAGKMVEMKRKKADGTYNWEHLSVLRILNNKTYAGYISYNKSYTKNFLGHKRVTVRDVSQYEYVKGNFPAIVSEETWNRVQAIKSKKVVIVDGRKCSKPISKDKWCRHLVCECGSVYGKYKWRTICERRKGYFTSWVFVRFKRNFKQYASCRGDVGRKIS